MTEQRTRGGQTIYTPDVAAEICQRLANGETLRAVCRDSHLPAESTVRQWALDDVNGFSAQYARAREIGYHSMFDELLEIADDGSNDRIERKNPDGTTTLVVDNEHVQRSKLRVDSRKALESAAETLWRAHHPGAYHRKQVACWHSGIGHRRSPAATLGEGWRR